MEQMNMDEPTLLEIARAQSDCDSDAGNRVWDRYPLGVSVEVATDPTNPFSRWSVTTHNVSGGGIGFWSERELDEGSIVHVQDSSDGDTGSWIPAQVKHCSPGLRGYFVGARFRYPVAPQAAADTDGATTGAPGGQVQPGRASTRMLLGGVIGGAGAALIGWAAMAPMALGPIAAPLGTAGVPAAAGAAGACVGALLAWWTMRGWRRDLRAVTASIGRLAEGTPLSAAPPVTSHEWVPIQAGVMAFQERLGAQARSERLQRQKLEEISTMKSNLIAIVSHDLRTPLASIQLYTKILTDDMGDIAPDDQRNFLEVIGTECARVSRLVDDLVEVQRLESDQSHWDLQAQDLSATVRAAVTMFDPLARSKHISLKLNCPPQLPQVKADSDKITQVISNLLSNALEHTPEDGEVTVTATARGERLVLSFSDSGPGVPRDRWDTVFERFSHIHDPEVDERNGSGLGLYIARKLVERHGGAVWVDSAPGSGAVFHVALPIQTQATGEVVVGRACAGRVVVCDSDPELAAVMAQVLRNHHYEVRTAHSARRLFNMLSNNPIDAVVTDVMLPDISAPDLLKHLKSIRKEETRLIVHTLAEEAEDLERFGVDQILRRPVSKADLVEAVEQALRRGRTLRQTVLAVGEVDQVREIRRQMAKAGHSTWVAETLEEAAEFVRQTPPAVVLITAEQLSPKWIELRALRLLMTPDQHLVVLVDTMDSAAVERADALGVAVIRHHFGTDNILESLTHARRSETAETEVEA